MALLHKFFTRIATRTSRGHVFAAIVRLPLTFNSFATKGLETTACNCCKLFHTSPTTLSAVQKFSVINIQDEEHFTKAVLDSKVPVVVDFHASWCGPCKHLAPRLEKVMFESGKEIVLAKVDIDELGDLAMHHKVTAVPSVIGMKSGKKVDQFVGLKDIDELKKFINKLVN